MDSFDETLVQLYRRKFADNVGLLCSVVQGRAAYDGPHGSKGRFPIHWEGSVFVSRETLERLCETGGIWTRASCQRSAACLRRADA